MATCGYNSVGQIFTAAVSGSNFISSGVVTQAGAPTGGYAYYTPFGTTRGGQVNLTQKRFTGQYHEATLPGGAGLYDYGARWYDPRVGRFITPDSFIPNPANPQDLNRYSYVRNNPLKYTDPSGHLSMPMRTPGDGGGSKPKPSNNGVVSTTRSRPRNPVEYTVQLIISYQQSPKIGQLKSLNQSAKRASNASSIRALTGAVDSKIQAYQLWQSMVGTGKELDIKGQVRKSFGLSAMLNGNEYYWDVWGNISYGYLGTEAGFAPVELLAGAGAQQVIDKLKNPAGITAQAAGSVALYQYLTENTGLVSFWDDPRDQAAIRVGIQLHQGQIAQGLEVTPARLLSIMDEYPILIGPPR